MALSAAEQAAIAIEFEEWREERASTWAATSAVAYGQWVQEREDLAKLEQIRLTIAEESINGKADTYDCIWNILYPEGTA